MRFMDYYGNSEILCLLQLFKFLVIKKIPLKISYK